MQINKFKVKAWIDFIIGIMFTILFTIILIYGIRGLFDSHQSYQLAMGIFIVIIGTLGTFEGSIMLQKSFKFIMKNKLV